MEIFLVPLKQYLRNVGASLPQQAAVHPRGFQALSGALEQSRTAPTSLPLTVSLHESAGLPLDVFGLNSILGSSLKSVDKQFKFV